MDPVFHNNFTLQSILRLLPNLLIPLQINLRLIERKKSRVFPNIFQFIRSQIQRGVQEIQIIIYFKIIISFLIVFKKIILQVKEKFQLLILTFKHDFIIKINLTTKITLIKIIRLVESNSFPTWTQSPFLGLEDYQVWNEFLGSFWVCWWCKSPGVLLLVFLLRLKGLSLDIGLVAFRLESRNGKPKRCSKVWFKWTHWGLWNSKVPKRGPFELNWFGKLFLIKNEHPKLFPNLS